LKKLLRNWLLRREVRREVARILQAIPQDFGGGCPKDKALRMVALICRFGLKTTVDIGVYRGRSFFPQAAAHRLVTRGVVYGVDPYQREEARQHDNRKLQTDLDRFIDGTDFDALYRSVAENIERWSLGENAKLLRETSGAAARSFRNRGLLCDLVHVDGNHDTSSVQVFCLSRIWKNAPFGLA
jgi:hypothetical protein